MSMRVLLSKAVAQGLLFQVGPRMPSEPMIRFLYASKDVHDYITGPWPNKEEEFRAVCSGPTLTDLLKVEGFLFL